MNLQFRRKKNEGEKQYKTPLLHEPLKILTTIAPTLSGVLSEIHSKLLKLGLPNNRSLLLEVVLVYAAYAPICAICSKTCLLTTTLAYAVPDVLYPYKRYCAPYILLSHRIPIIEIVAMAKVSWRSTRSLNIYLIFMCRSVLLWRQ
jgi:hypothetical protein